MSGAGYRVGCRKTEDGKGKTGEVSGETDAGRQRTEDGSRLSGELCRRLVAAAVISGIAKRRVRGDSSNEATTESPVFFAHLHNALAPDNSKLQGYFAGSA